jgi:hypothetical protein
MSKISDDYFPPRILDSGQLLIAGILCKVRSTYLLLVERQQTS